MKFILLSLLTTFAHAAVDVRTESVKCAASIRGRELTVRPNPAETNATWKSFIAKSADYDITFAVDPEREVNYVRVLDKRTGIASHAGTFKLKRHYRRNTIVCPTEDPMIICGNNSEDTVTTQFRINIVPTDESLSLTAACWIRINN